MSFTYNAAWSGARDYVRFLVRDTVGATAAFQDEELDGLLAQWGGDARMAAAEALEAWAGKLSRNAVKYYVTGFGMDRTRTAEFMLKTAKSLREAALSVPFEFESLLEHQITLHGEDWSSYPDTAADDGPDVQP